MIKNLRKKKNLKMQFRVLMFTIIISDYSYNHYWRLLRDENWLWLHIITDCVQSAPVCYCICAGQFQRHLLVNTTVNLKHWHILSKHFSHNHLLQNLTQAFRSFQPSLFQQSVISIQLQNPPSLADCHLPQGTAESVNSSV